MCRASRSLLAPALLAGAALLCASRSTPISAQHPAARRDSRPALAATEIWAFTGPWDSASDSSLAHHASALDVVVTGWIGLDSTSAEPILPSPYIDRFASDAVSRRDGPARFAIVTSWHGLRFHPSSIRALAADRQRLGRVASKIARTSHDIGYSGLVLDFEDEKPAELGQLLVVVKAITDSAHEHGLRRVAIAVPAADTLAYPTRPLLGATDLLLPMLYDEHWDRSPPGAISEPKWVRATLAARVAGVDPARIVAGLPTYAYEWPAGRPGEQISFAAARRIADSSGVAFTRDRATSTLHAVEPQGGQLWVTDAELLRGLIDVVHSLGVTRVSLWRLGQEDPAIWSRPLR